MKEKCPFCTKEIDQTDKFCPNCGNKLPEKNLPFSTAQKVKIYFLSIFLAPFGFYWFFKYFRNQNSEKRKLAYNVLYISIVMIIVLIIINFYFVKTLQTYIDSYNLVNLGY
ncbi:zinc ribbon domain-containing protein [Patescibacteria group bacterium]|nr:zinc ribbon domain-containing protein [Patescibacteria group bacterium]